MSIEEKIDQVKGAAKEGVGKLTGDKKIEKEKKKRNENDEGEQIMKKRKLNEEEKALLEEKLILCYKEKKITFDGIFFVFQKIKVFNKRW